MGTPAPVIYVDLRCLQDPEYRLRDIGLHIQFLLKERFNVKQVQRWRLVGLVSDTLPKLPTEYSQLCDDISLSTNPSVSQPAIFLYTSPMTHEGEFCMRLLSHPLIRTAAILNDSIPRERLGNISRLSERMECVAKLLQLSSVDVFFTTTEDSSRRLCELLGLSRDRVVVTGAVVRPASVAAANQPPVPRVPAVPPYVVVMGEVDANRNLETVLKAVGTIKQRQPGHPVRLSIVGVQADRLRALVVAMCISDATDFFPNPSDGELASLFSGASVSVAPSYSEDSSLRIVEAIACGSPVIASDCQAHADLLGNPDSLFAIDEPERLALLLGSLLDDPKRRARLVAEQATVAQQFQSESVANCFWSKLADWFRSDSLTTARSHRKTKPKVAILSPYLPEKSGVARFTQAMLSAAQGSFDVDLYTDAPRPLGSLSGRDAGPMKTTHVLLGGVYDSIISVLGNSPYHLGAFEFMERFGGPCILHDSRLTHVCYARFGEEGLLRMAREISGRPCIPSDLPDWFEDRNLPCLFVEPLLARASPLIVHSELYKDILQSKYEVEPKRLTFPPTMYFRDQELTRGAREQARAELGWQPEDFAISTFGHVTLTKQIFTCISAVGILRDRGIRASLHFVGEAGALQPVITQVAHQLGIVDYVHSFGIFVAEKTYRTYMRASDAGVQLRNYCYGAPSAALADSSSAALPVVAARDLASACEVPEYVRRVPDDALPSIVADALNAIWEERQDRELHFEARRAYLETHNFDYYVEQLSTVLGFS